GPPPPDPDSAHARARVEPRRLQRQHHPATAVSRAPRNRRHRDGKARGRAHAPQELGHADITTPDRGACPGRASEQPPRSSTLDHQAHEARLAADLGGSANARRLRADVYVGTWDAGWGGGELAFDF